MSGAINLVVFIFVAMEALGGLWVTGEEAGPGDHFLCTVRICGYEITTELLLGSRAEGCSPSCGEWMGLVILPFFWLVSGAPINSLKYHLLQEALPVLPEWRCCPPLHRAFLQPSLTAVPLSPSGSVPCASLALFLCHLQASRL